MSSVKLTTIQLKTSQEYNERWVQEQIAKDPSILGLGELTLRDKERIQSGAGRLDLLLQDPEIPKRYEVELQLGSLDESHIIRTVEYWDYERKRYPQYEHVAVIVAEEITSRFLNVIQLFNGVIPLIAMKMTAYKVGNDVALTFVKVIDELSFGLVEEDEPIAEPADRSYWEKKGSKSSLELVDNLLEVIRPVEPTVVLRYNRHYIGLTKNNSPLNFIQFKPQKQSVVVEIKLPSNEEYDSLIEDAGFETLSYQTTWRLYRLRVDSRITDKQKQALLELSRKAREMFGKTR